MNYEKCILHQVACSGTSPNSPLRCKYCKYCLTWQRWHILDIVQSYVYYFDCQMVKNSWMEMKTLLFIEDGCLQKDVVLFLWLFCKSKIKDEGRGLGTPADRGKMYPESGEVYPRCNTKCVRIWMVRNHVTALQLFPFYLDEVCGSLMWSSHVSFHIHFTMCWQNI